MTTPIRQHDAVTVAAITPPRAESQASADASTLRLFDTIADMGHEQLVVCHDKASGYRGIIAIHDTTLGPCLLYTSPSPRDGLLSRMPSSA